MQIFFHSFIFSSSLDSFKDCYTRFWKSSVKKLWHDHRHKRFTKNCWTVRFKPKIIYLIKNNLYLYICFFKRYNLTSEDVRNEAKFDDSIGIFPEFIDGYNILILPTTGRYFQVSTYTYVFVYLLTSSQSGLRTLFSCVIFCFRIRSSNF